MSDLKARASLADRGQAFGLRLISRAGGLEAVKNPAVRQRLEKALYTSAKQGFRAQTAATRSFARRSGSGDATRPAKATPRREFDLTPNEDQETFRQVARELADEVLRPAAKDADVACAVPAEVRAAGDELGLRLLAVPTDLGGITEERAAVTGVLVMEELSRGDMGLAVGLMASGAVAGILAAYGDATQQQTYLLPLTDEKDPAAGALALMEPQPLFDPLQPQTHGSADGNDLVLNGVKAMVPQATEADIYIVSALVAGEPRLVILESGTPGLSVEADPGMGVRASATAKLTLEDVRVSADNLLGTAEDHLDVVRRGRLAWAAAAVGTAQAVLDQVSTYVTERQAFGEPIGYRQSVAFLVADMAIEVDALRLVVWRAAALLDAGKDASASIAHARRLAAIHGAKIGSDGVQLLGGHGFVKEFDNERWFRDLRATGVIEGGLWV
ncbi:acyl-CoA dehydrogenase family protein [Dermacoccaceae bacterium W4C1]